MSPTATLRRLIRRMPAGVRHPLMRRFFRFDPDRANAIEVRPARTGTEYHQAFSVLFDAYNAVHFFDGGNDPRSFAARALYYPAAALPTSTVLIALLDGRVVGTTTIIRDTAMGLAADRLLGDAKTPLVSRGQRISELSMLAVAPEHRRNGDILFALLRYAAMVYMERERVDTAVCTTNTALADALRGLMLFQQITPVFTHPKSGARTTGLCVDFHSIEARGRAVYRGAPRDRDLARFFFDDGRARVQLPRSEWVTTTLPKLRAHEWPAAFRSPEDFREGTTAAGLLVVRNALSAPMRDALADWVPPGAKPDRETRYDTHLPAQLRVGRDASPVAGTIEQISEHGAFITSDAPLRVGDELTLEASPAANRTTLAHGRVVWSRHGRQFGIALSAADTTWTEYVRYLESWLWGSAGETARGSSRLSEIGDCPGGAEGVRR